jgi:monooxygenase
VLRGTDTMPKQGPAAPWRTHRTYPQDVRTMRYGPLNDCVRFESTAAHSGKQAA